MIHINQICLGEYCRDFVRLNHVKINGISALYTGSSINPYNTRSLAIIKIYPTKRIYNACKKAGITGIASDGDPRLEAFGVLYFSFWFSNFRSFEQKYYSFVNKPSKVKLPKYKPREDVLLE